MATFSIFMTSFPLSRATKARCYCMAKSVKDSPTTKSIPKPWARLPVIIGNELRIPPDLNDEELERWRKEAEKELNRASLVEPKDYL